jgi:hypothetical protein
MHDARESSQLGSCPCEAPRAIRISAGVRTLTTTAWARAALDDNRGGQAVVRRWIALQPAALSARVPVPVGRLGLDLRYGGGHLQPVRSRSAELRRAPLLWQPRGHVIGRAAASSQSPNPVRLRHPRPTRGRAVTPAARAAPGSGRTLASEVLHRPPRRRARSLTQDRRRLPGRDETAAHLV